MFICKLKIGILVVAAALLTTGAGVAAFRALAAPQPLAPQDENRTATVKERASTEKEKPKPTRNLTVRVVDSQGKPVADAEVYFLVGYQDVAAEGKTDAEGRWSGQVPAVAKVWGLLARKANIGFDYAVPTPKPGYRDEMEPLPDEVKLTLDGARTLRVKALDQHGKPVAGVQVGPWYIKKPGREREINFGGMYKRCPRTDKNGIAVFDWLPKQFTQAIPMIPRHEDYFALDDQPAIMADKPVEEMTIPLLPMEKLSGRIMYADGRPAAGIVIAAQGKGASFNEFRGSATTDTEGRYAVKVYSEYAYIVAVQDKRWSAPYRTGIVVRIGKPMANVDFVLSKATRLRGRITIGKDNRPASGLYLSLMIDRGEIPPELRRPNDRTYHAVRMDFHTETDKDGHYEFFLGPGKYQLQSHNRLQPVKITIPTANPPAEIIRDLSMPRPEMGRFTGRVVDAGGRPVAGAVVDGTYAAQTGFWFPPVKTDAQGRFTVERSLDPLVLRAQTADKGRAGIVRIDAEASEAKIVIRPVAKASGRLLDLQGKPLAGKELPYGIRVYLGDAKISAWTDSFGGKALTDADGHFTLAGLVPGETYHVMIPLSETSWSDIKQVKPNSAQALDLGDMRADHAQADRPSPQPRAVGRAAESTGKE